MNKKIQDTTPEPKIFISYSWTSQEYKERIKEWANRLLSDGIDVVFDVYDLRQGDDKYQFMERMLTDKSITHVLIFCNQKYAERADNREAGAGAETQIISEEIYEKTQESKSILPIVTEFSNDLQKKACVPKFLNGKIYIDFSSPEAVNRNWEELIRSLYEKPLDQKPGLGETPQYIINDNKDPVNPAIEKFSQFRSAFLSDQKWASEYRNTFLDACISYADALRIRERPNTDPLGEKIIEDFIKLKQVRNLLVDWILLEADKTSQDEFGKLLIELLEKVLELKYRPKEVTLYRNAWSDAHVLFVYETFLYMIAALLKAKAFHVLHEIFTTHYLLPNTAAYPERDFVMFQEFHGDSEVIREMRKFRNHRSPQGELFKEQAERNDLPFSDIMQAEALILLMACLRDELYWYPCTLVYASSDQRSFPFFIRAAQHKYFESLAIITGIDDADSIREKIKRKSDLDRYSTSSYAQGMRWRYESLINLKNLDTMK